MAHATSHSPPHAPASHRREAGRGRSWRAYLPLAVLLALTAGAAAAQQASLAGPFDGRFWMRDFMGLFLVVFAMFKLFDLEGFADGFQMYDLLAGRFRPYAYAYPFIEAALGFGYLASWNLPLVAALTVAVLGFGACGVLRALAKGLDVDCACMGTILRVPLSTVALLEDLGMAAMAAALLFR